MNFGFDRFINSKKHSKPNKISETKIYGNRAVSLLLKALNKNFPLFANKSAYQNFFSDEINEIYKLSHVNNTNIQIESLRFIFQSEQAQGFVSDRYYRALYEFILPVPAIRSITYKSQALLFNLLMISIKEDTNISRVKAFVKRILQVCLISEPPFILAGLMLLSEIVKIHKSIIQLMQVLSDDEEEAYEDVLDSDIEEEKTENHAETTKKPSKRTDYDPLKRDPKFSAAENAGLYELGILCKHPHPTISK